MIAALLAGAILMLVVGFVLGWAWDKRPGALQGVSILDVMTAFGTVGAVLVALYVSFGESRAKTLQRLSRSDLYRGMLVSGMAGVWDSVVEIYNLIEALNEDCLSQQRALRLKNISNQSNDIFFVDALVDHIAMAESLPAQEMQRVTSLHGYMKMLQRLGPDLARQLDGDKCEAKRVSTRMALAVKSIGFLCGEIECLRDAMKEAELVMANGKS